MPAMRVYEYGLLPPHANAELVDKQMLMAHRYRNTLVEIERERRQLVRAAMAAHPDLAPIEEELRSLIQQRDTLREEVSAQRRRTRSRSESQEQRQAILDLTAKIKPLREHVKEVRKAVAQDSTVRLAMEEAERHAKARLKKARAECGVYWGTYLLQEQAADQARRERMPPNFARWQGEGRVSVQIQKGIAVEELWGGDTQIQIEPVNPHAWDLGTRRGARRRMSRTILRLRIGSEGAGNRTPIWGEWRMVMHRPIPQGGVIKLATVSRRRRDCVSWEWRVHLTVDVSACEPRGVVPKSGVVALNLGFCLRQDGAIRSGYLVGDDGMEREILVAKSDDVRTGREVPGLPRREDEESRDSPEQYDPGLEQNIMTPTGDTVTSHAEHGRMSMAYGLDEESHETSPATPGHRVSVPQEASPAAPGRDGCHGRSDERANWILNGLTKADSIRSFRDKALNSMKDLLCAWRGGNAVDGDAIQALIDEWSWSRRARSEAETRGGQAFIAQEVREGLPASIAGGKIAISQEALPEWFGKATEALHAWRSADRFRRLAYEWDVQRFLGDEVVFRLVWAWRERDEHLERYESGLRRSALRDRREGYRIIAAQMARRYQILVIDDTDLTLFQRSQEVESKKVDIPIVKRNQRYAAGSVLRSAMINAFGPDRVVRLDHKDMTRRCHLCGHINHWDRIEHGRCHTCDGCGVRWDQDSNNGKNLLAEHRRAVERGDMNTPDVRKKSRSDRFKDARANRTASRGESPGSAPGL